MLVEALMGMMYTVLDWLTAIFDIPGMPDGVSTAMQTVLDYMTMGLTYVANFTHLDYLLALFGIILAFDIGVFGYKVVMWVLRKIPMLGIK